MANEDFSLPDGSKFENIDEVPETIRKFYFEKDGKIHQQDPAAMASTMAKVRRENEKLSKELLETQNWRAEMVEVLGDDADPALIKSWKEKAAKAEDLPTDQDVEKRIKLIEENHKKALGLKDNEIKSRDLTIERVTINGMLRDALIAVDANKEGKEFLPNQMRGRVEKKINEDGTVELYPLDRDGTRMYAEDGSPATLIDLANEYRNNHPIFFNGSKASGMGANGETVTLPKDAKDWGEMDAQERRAFQKKHGTEAATALMMRSAAASAASS